jgi:4-hydroxy-tetrahydrodipicolinate synthase
VTPFRDGAVDDTAFLHLCDLQVAAGLGLVVGSDIGEGLMLEPSELLHLVGLAGQAAQGQVPVLGYLDFATHRDPAAVGRAMVRGGADSLICRLPPASVFGVEDAYGYVRQISHRVDRPVLLDLGADRDAAPGIEAMAVSLFKTELISGAVLHDLDPVHLAHRRAGCGDHFLQLVAEDSLAPCHLAGGGSGWISALANIAPRACAALASAWDEGEMGQFVAIRDALYVADAALRRTRPPAGLKAVLEAAGVLDGAVRRPMRRVTPAADTELLPAVEALLRLERTIALPVLPAASLPFVQARAEAHPH